MLDYTALMDRAHEDACCPRCRLVQKQRVFCRGCGAAHPRVIDKPTDLFHHRIGRWWPILNALTIFPGTFLFLGGCLCLLAKIMPQAGDTLIMSDALVFPVILLILFYYILVVVIFSIVDKRQKKKRSQLRPLDQPPPGADRRARVQGTAMPLEATVSSFLGSTPCLAASLELRQGPGGGLYLRFARAEGFLLQREDGGPVLVCGELLLEGFSPASQQPAEGSSRLLQRVFPSLTSRVPAGAFELLVREGDRVEVSGEKPRLEVVEDLGRGYRDNGVLVMRGEPGRPLGVRPVP